MSPRLARVVCVAHGVVLAGILLPVPFAVLGIHPVAAASLIESSVVVCFAAAALLMLVMLVACVNDRSLTPSERLRWELALVVGGPITSLLYFLRRARRGL